MRFLVDENFPADAVTQLHAAGHDVVWVHTIAPGNSDEDVLAWAAREDRIVLTFDKDFGELAWRNGLPASCGVVLLRLPRCRRRPRLARCLPQESANALIGPDTSAFLNLEGSECARFRQNSPN
jgi:predicted nuclease of predicted toxin-antitoxin system